VIGLLDEDEFVQHQLLLSALNITTHILEPGGTFIAKLFRGREVFRVFALLQQFFDTVTLTKPKACRHSSIGRCSCTTRPDVLDVDHLRFASMMSHGMIIDAFGANWHLISIFRRICVMSRLRSTPWICSIDG